jgi:hypothetical protein
MGNYWSDERKGPNEGSFQREKRRNEIRERDCGVNGKWQSELSHLGMGRHQAFGGCVTTLPSPGREKRPFFFAFRTGNRKPPCDHFWGRLFIILDLPLLLPDAIGTGGGMQSTGLATAVHKRAMWFTVQ